MGGGGKKEIIWKEVSRSEKENPIKILKRKKKEFFIELFELKNQTSVSNNKLHRQVNFSIFIIYFLRTFTFYSVKWEDVVMLYSIRKCNDKETWIYNWLGKSVPVLCFEGSMFMVIQDCSASGSLKCCDLSVF